MVIVRLKQEQLVLLALVTVFFGLQVLPHQITLLHNSGISFFYVFIAMLLVPTILVCAAIALLGIALTRAPERMHWQKWFSTFVFMLVAGIILTICNVACARGLPVGSYVRHFNPQVWAQPASNQYVPGDITLRQKMLGDVIHSIVRNKSKASIIALLGPSDGGDYFAESGRDLIYHMGPQRDSVFAIDDEWLLIWFDSTDRVSRYEVWSD
jgi:hypothetical protein